jgi:HK97 family phage prohead protease
MSNPKIERRMFSGVEFRAVREDGKPTKLEGYAAVFNQPSEDLGGFRETIKPGAFTDTLAAKADVRALFNHDPNFVLGRSKSGTLRLAQDNTGLRISCDMPDTQVARDLMTLCERGDIDQMSFGFYVDEENWNQSKDANGDVVYSRELVKCSLFDVSAVTYPAYPQTSVEARSKFCFPEGKPEIRVSVATPAEVIQVEKLRDARRRMAQIRTNDLRK